MGRSAELDLFTKALESPGDSFTVLFVHGPGGVGKSALLGELAELAVGAAATPVTVDARAVSPSPPGLLAAMRAALGLADGESVVDALNDGRRHVLLFDTYELLEPVDDWVREQFLPELPTDTLVAIAGRNPPAARWVSDPGWRALMCVVSLRNLRPDDTREYLRIEKVPESSHDNVLAMTHGHPLTLSMLVDAIRHDPDVDRPVPQALGDSPDVVRALLTRMIESVPSPRHQEALEVCAHARFTNEELLRTVLGGTDAGSLFSWLRAQSFMDNGSRGLFPHDVTRDLLDADLRWRDPAGYADLHRRLRTHLVDLVRRAGDDTLEKQHRLTDAIFLTRNHPITRGYWELATLARAYADGMRPAEASTLVELTRVHQGPEQAGFAEYWMTRQPEAFRVFRGVSGEVIGYAAYLALHEASQSDLDTDPGARAIWDYALRNGAPRPGEQVMAWRFFVDTESHDRPSRSENLTRLWHGQEAITRTGCAWDLSTVYADRDYWDPLFAYFDYHLAPEAGHRIGGRDYDVYGHDWRVRGVEDWLAMLGERELGAPVTQSTGPRTEVVLSEPDFLDAVRAALRVLHQPDRLATNPLTRSRLVRNHGGDPVEALRVLLIDASETLRDDPRQASLHRVIDRTFLRPAPTQERAAELLGLPFSTYRRYRDRALERIVAWLWQRELNGPAH